MEDEIIKSIFENYNPELSSDFQFLDKLQRNLNSVEIIKQNHKLFISRNRIALLIATMTGFLVGVLSSFLLPYFSMAISEGLQSIPDTVRLNCIFGKIENAAWILIGFVAVTTAVNSYKLSLYLLKEKFSI